MNANPDGLIRDLATIIARCDSIQHGAISDEMRDSVSITLALADVEGLATSLQAVCDTYASGGQESVVPGEPAPAPPSKTARPKRTPRARLRELSPAMRAVLARQMRDAAQETGAWLADVRQALEEAGAQNAVVRATAMKLLLQSNDALAQRVRGFHAAIYRTARFSFLGFEV